MKHVSVTLPRNISNEKGRTLLEISAILAISAVLIMGGLLGYKYMLEKEQLNELIHTINMTDTRILGALQDKSFSNPTSMNAFLNNYTQYVRGYKISFYAPENNFSGKEFATKVETLDGSPLKPRICKNLILEMQSLHSISSLDVEKNRINRHIEMGTVDLDTIFGK